MKTFVLIFFLTLVSAITAYALCPTTKDETELDCPWSEIARSKPQELEAQLNLKAPGLKTQLTKDKHAKGLFELWGSSKNYDGAPERVIVSEHILEFLHKSLGIKKDDSDFSVNHAGITHTYGYLFSVLSTPYGYKRARYVKGEIESGFGLPLGVFSGEPSEGTLLANFTFFLTQISLGKERISLPQIKSWALHPELKKFNYQELKKISLVETAPGIEIRTDFIPFTHSNTRGTNEGIYIYSVKEGANTPRLITAFPVTLLSAKKLFDSNGLGENKTIKLVFNGALIDPKKPSEWIGTRTQVGSF